MATTTRTRKPARRASKNRAAASAPVSNDPIDKMKAVEAHVNTRIVGRDELTRGIVISLIAGQNVLALGVPGTAKTMLVQAISESFANDDDVFDILLTKFTKDKEVFGPTDVQALANGEQKIKTKGYLPSAKVGALDEIFKGSSAVLNGLLRIANERTFRNGTTVEMTDVRMLVGMSNEYPEDPALLAAFYDRFPSKFIVEYLDGDDFTKMLNVAANGSKPAPMTVKLTDDDFDEITRRVDSVNLPAEIIEALGDIRAALKAKNVVISDRRWVQAVKLMKAHAVYNGRTTVSRRDLCVLEPVAWNTDNDRSVIGSILPEYLNPFEGELRVITDEAYAARTAILKAANYDGSDDTRPSPDIAKAASEAAKGFVTIKGQKARLDAIEDLVEDDSDSDLLDAARESIESVEHAVKLIVKGKDGLDALAATEDDDI